MAYEDEEDFGNGETEAEAGGGEPGDKKEDNTISIAELVLLLCVTVPADVFELIATFTAWVPIIGWGTYGIYILIGAVASSVIFLWSIFRSTGKDLKLAETMAKRIIIVLIGAVFGEVIPFLRTLSIIIVFWMHNKAARAPKRSGLVGKALQENPL